MNHAGTRGFSLIEILVIVTIIGILSGVAGVAMFDARVRSRDAKRIADISSLTTALELFVNVRGTYPNGDGVELGTGEAKVLCESGWSVSCAEGEKAYMSIVPAAARPEDGECSGEQNRFLYTATDEGKGFEISYCFGKNVGNLAPGMHIADEAGVR